LWGVNSRQEEKIQLFKGNQKREWKRTATAPLKSRGGGSSRRGKKKKKHDSWSRKKNVSCKPYEWAMRKTSTVVVRENRKIKK